MVHFVALLKQCTRKVGKFPKAVPAWEEGLWLGRGTESNQRFVATPHGVFKTCSLRRRPPRCSQDLCFSFGIGKNIDFQRGSKELSVGGGVLNWLANSGHVETPPPLNGEQQSGEEPSPANFQVKARLVSHSCRFSPVLLGLFRASSSWRRGNPYYPY